MSSPITSAEICVAAGKLKIGFNREQSFLAVLLLLMMVLNYLDRQALAIVAPMMRKELGLSIMQYANAVNAFLLAYCVMYTGSGVILDRIGYRLGLAWFVGIWSIISGLHAAIIGFATLALFRFLLGLAEPAGFTGAIKTISERFGPAQRSLATGFLNVGAGLGSLIAAPLMVFLSLHYGWRTAFLVASSAGLLWVPLWLRATKPFEATSSAVQPAPARSFRQNVALLRDRRVLAYVLTRFFGDNSGYFILFWLPEYLVSAKHFSFAMLGTLGWIPLLGSDAGAILGGYFSSLLVQSGRSPVLSRKVMMTLAALLVTIGAILQTGSGLAIVLISMSICTLGVGMWACNLHALATDAFPKPVVATIHGTAGSAGALAGLIFNSLVGYFSGRHLYGAVLFMFASLLPVAVAPLWIWMREPGQNAESSPVAPPA